MKIYVGAAFQIKGKETKNFCFLLCNKTYLLCEPYIIVPFQEFEEFLSIVRKKVTSSKNAILHFK